MKKLVVTLFVLALLVVGCEEAFYKGVATGVGASSATTEATELAKEAKATLVAEILSLRTKLEETPDPVEKAALEDKLAELQKQADVATITATVLDTVMAAAKKDWSTDDPQEKAANYRWLVELIFGLGLAGYGLNERNNKLKLLNEATENRISALETNNNMPRSG